jgi:pyruvate,water dikinase
VERLDKNRAGVGGKAANVAWLIEHGESVPTTWVIAPDYPATAIEEAVRKNLPARQPYAVRSSANVEDGKLASYAGQFGSELDVAREDLPEAVRRVRRSVESERVATYRARLDAANGIAITVMIQPMVRPVVSGVAFSRNPMTGLNEVVIEAVAGRGDRLVGEGVTPERWIHRWGNLIESPDSDLLPERVIERLASDTRRIAAARGEPVDLEWVWDGEKVWWVQLRPITGLSDVAIYSNRISREVMPGIIKPLVWSVNVPMVNRAWVELFTEAIGSNDIRPEELARSFAYRSYFNMGTIGDIFELMGMPRDSLELLLGLPAGSDQPSFKPSRKTMRLLPRMVRLAARKARYGTTVPREVASLRGAYSKFEAADLAARSDSALLSDLRALSDLGVRAAYANIVTPLLANVYNTLLRKRLIRAGLDPETVEIGSEGDVAAWDPNVHLTALSRAVEELSTAEIAEIREQGYPALPEPIRGRFDEFLDRFGHISASGNDFSVAPWHEMPDEVVLMALDHAAMHGETSRLEWAVAEEQVSRPERLLMRALRNRTREFVAHRENVSFTYTYGYGLFRRYYLEVGRRLVDRDLLAEPTDVMYLYNNEVRAALLGQPSDAPIRDLVDTRRREIESVEDLVMPEVIYGDDFVPARGDMATGVLTGIPTSRGHYRGILRVVRDTADFGKVEAGDVIAIPYSDVGWTPLFARAGAVVAAAGGMLSHSSIVAREYRIPCVVSVEGAMQLVDGATVTVDGYAGTVVLEAG